MELSPILSDPSFGIPYSPVQQFSFSIYLEIRSRLYYETTTMNVCPKVTIPQFLMEVTFTIWHQFDWYGQLSAPIDLFVVLFRVCSPVEQMEADQLQNFDLRNLP